MTKKPKTGAAPTDSPLAATGPAGQQAENRRELIGRLLEDAKDLDCCDLEILITFANLVARNRGCMTPAEEFILSLTKSYHHRNGALHPLEARTLLQEFEADHDDAIETARLMAQRFPKEMLASPGSVKVTAQEVQ